MNSDTPSFLFASNPFATHRVRPGALRYQFSDGQNADQILETMKQNKWRGQIVGPHGSGKTTLLNTLEHRWKELGRRTISIALRDRQRHLPKVDWSQHNQMIVDGYEQLSLQSRLLLNMRCRIRQCGLLVTTHTTVRGMTVVCRTSTSPELVQSLTRQLDRPMSADAIGTCFTQANGNVRETFMLLYDLVETSHQNQRVEASNLGN